MLIRPISSQDNEQIAAAIRAVLIEFGVPKVGTAYADASLDDMTKNYSKPKHQYFVIECNGEILGGAGIAPLDNYAGNVCELQKMYFRKEARGMGLGAKMMALCLDFAKQNGFEKCYLETMPYMEDARKLYRKVGFEELSGPMGDTGHFSCTMWMIKTL